MAPPLLSLLRMKMSGRHYIFLLLFFCSGATALVYEVIWSKFLSQMFGSTIYAQTVVLAVFMGASTTLLRARSKSDSSSAQ